MSNYEEFDEMWKVFVDESSSFGQTDNPVIRINICRRCGATDNFHDPHIPSQFKHSVDADSCSRCDSFGAEEFGAEGETLYIRRSSIFDNPDRKYDIPLYTKILKKAGATKVWTENAYGWSNQPEVVIFTGLNRHEAEKALEQGVSYGEWMIVSNKDAHWDAEEFGAEVHLYDDGEYEYGMGFITSNKEKYREKIISRIQDSNWMDEYEPTKNDIKEGFPADDDYSTFMKRQREWLSKKSDAQLKKMLKKAYPNGLEKKIDLDEKVLNIAGNRKGLDIMLEAEEYKHCDECEEVRSIEEFSLSNDPEQTLTEGEVCDYCFGDFYDAEGINLRKRIEDLIDLREINFTGFKKDTKRDAVKRARRIENEIKGVLPKGKSYKVDKPKWFTIAQTGIVLGVAGLVGYSGFKGKE